MIDSIPIPTGTRLRVLPEGAFSMHGTTWYGVPYSISVGGSFWHHAGLRGVSVPHPPVVNGLLRYGMNRSSAKRLAAYHELGHLQTLPLDLLHGASLFWLSYHDPAGMFLSGVPLVLAFFAFSELAAELYTRRALGSFYVRSYRTVPRFQRRVFWYGMSSLVLWGWANLLGL